VKGIKMTQTKKGIMKIKMRKDIILRVKKMQNENVDHIKALVKEWQK
jgi:hypothetical protein